MRGEPVPIVGFTAMTGVLPSFPASPLLPGEPDGPGEPEAPEGITKESRLLDDDHETVGLDPALVGETLTDEIGAVSSESHTTLRTPELRVILETLSVESHSLFPKEMVEPRIPEGITIENLVPLYETTADGPVVILTTEEDPEKLKVGSGIGVGLEMLPTDSQRNESSPESLNFNPLTASPLEHFSDEEKSSPSVSFSTERSSKSDSSEDPVEPHSYVRVPETRVSFLTALPELQPPLEYVPGAAIVITPCIAESAVVIAEGIEVAQTGLIFGSVKLKPITP